jgi:hypothetical protein
LYNPAVPNGRTARTSTAAHYKPQQQPQQQPQQRPQQQQPQPLLQAKLGDQDDDDMSFPSVPSLQRGVSIDQDGKSNVWAIEPKMEVSPKTSDETTQTILVAGAGLAVAAIMAGLVLTHMPDPNQF